MHNINVRSFTPAGSDACKRLIQNKPNNILSEVKKLIEENSITVETGAVLELRSPRNRYDLAKILWEVFGNDGLLYPDRRKIDLWNWVSAVYFEILINPTNYSCDIITYPVPTSMPTGYTKPTNGNYYVTGYTGSAIHPTVILTSKINEILGFETNYSTPINMSETLPNTYQ